MPPRREEGVRLRAGALREDVVIELSTMGTAVLVSTNQQQNVHVITEDKSCPQSKPHFSVSPEP